MLGHIYIVTMESAFGNMKVESIDMSKRNQEEVTCNSLEKKARSRESEIVITRLCVSRFDFGKLIGKGGQVIENIRVVFISSSVLML